MKAPAKNDPAQLAFPAFIPVVTSLGNGTFRAEMGKPLYWLTAKQFAAQFGVDRDTVYRWREDGTIPRQTEAAPGEKPRELVREAGMRRWLFSSELIPLLREQFRQLHA